MTIKQIEQNNQQKTLIIADSNRRSLINHVATVNNEWSPINTKYTVESLEKLVKEEGEDLIQPFAIAYILQGTNNIKNGEDGLKTAERVLDITDKITKMTVNKSIPVIIQLPPIGPSYNANVFAEHSLFNYTIGNNKTINIKTDEILKNITSPLNDDLHLNSWAGEKNTREMNNISSNSGNLKTERDGKQKTVTCIFF